MRSWSTTQRIWFVPLIILIVITLFVSLIYVFDREKFLGKTFDEKTITVGLKIREIDSNRVSFLNISSSQKALFSVLNEGLVLVSLDYIYIPKSLFLGDNQQACIEKLNIEDFGNPISSVPIRGQGLIVSEVPVCISFGKNYIFTDYLSEENLSNNPPASEIFATVAYNKYSDPYFFPFDTRQIKFRINLESHILRNGEQEALDIRDINYEMTNPDLRWEFSTEQGGNNLDKFLILSFYRPVIYPALVFIISFILLIIIIYHIYRFDIEVEVYWQVIFGLFLGIWSIDQVLVPQYIDHPTIVTSIILALWLIVSLSMAYELFVKPLIRKRLTFQAISIDDLVRQIVARKSESGLYKWTQQKVLEGTNKSDIIRALEIKEARANSLERKKKLKALRDRLINDE